MVEASRVAEAAVADWPDDEFRQVATGTHSGVLSADDDQDRLMVPVQAGDVIEVSLSKEQGDAVIADVSWPGEFVTLEGDSGTGRYTRGTVEEDGFVEVTVRTDEAVDGGLPWNVTITDEPATDRWGDDTSVQVSSGRYSGKTNTFDDTDEFRVPVEAGEVYRVSLSKEQGDPVIADVSWPGEFVTLEDDAGANRYTRATIEEDGFIEVTVYTDEFVDPGLPWNVSVTGETDRDEWIDDTTFETSTGTHSGRVNTFDDTDEFRVPVEAGEVYRVSLSKEQGDPVIADVSWPGEFVTLEDDAGTDRYTRATIEEDGFIEVTVQTDEFVDPGLPWNVSVTRESPSDTWDDDTYEQVSPGTIEGTVNTFDDTDEFKIPVEAGEVYRVSLSKEQGDPVIADVSWPGEFVTLEGDSGTGRYTRATIEEDGFIEVTVQTDEFVDPGLPWNVSVTRESPSDTWDDDTYEQVSPGTIEGTVNSWDDTDEFRIPVQAGEVYQIQVDKQQGDPLVVDLSWPGEYGITLDDDEGTGDSVEAAIEDDGFIEISIDTDEFVDPGLPWAVTVTSDDVTIPGERGEVRLGADAAPATPGGNATVTFTVGNDRSNATGLILNLTRLPEDFSIVDQSSGGGTWNPGERKWLFQTVESGGAKSATVTLAVPEGANGTYTVSAAVLDDEGVVNTTTVELRTTLSIPDAIDENGDGEIGDFEILQAIEYWRTNEPVPRTGGKTIGDFDILDLIEQWRTNEAL